MSLLSQCRCRSQRMATLPTVGEQNVTDLRTTFDLADPGLNVDLPPRAMSAFAIIRTGPVGASWRSIAVMPSSTEGPKDRDGFRRGILEHASNLAQTGIDEVRRECAPWSLGMIGTRAMHERA